MANATSGYTPAYSADESRQMHAAVDLQNWQEPGPLMRWSHQRLSELLPQAVIHRLGPISTLAEAPRTAVAEQLVATERLGSVALERYVHASGVVDGVVIVQRGAIVYERYPRMRPFDTHIWWSIAKSLVATLVAVLEERGLVDVSAPVEAYLPEVAGSGWQGVAIRDVLDMASGISCSESEGAYGDPHICVSRYEASLGLLPLTAQTPSDTWEFVAALPRAAQPGVAFDYASVNTFLLGVLVERVSGLPFAELATRELWSRIGAEADASIVISRNGAAVTHGGLCSTLRDLARYGLLFTPSWPVVTAEQIISERYLDAIQHGGRPELFARGTSGASRTDALGGEHPRHNTYQWDLVMPDGDFYKGGYAGQGLYISPARDLVIAFFGSLGTPEDASEMLYVARQLAVSGLFRG